MMDRKEKGSSVPKPRYVWDPKKLAWVETTEAETTEEAVPEKAAVEPTREEVLEEVKAKTGAEEVSGEAAAESAPVKGAVEAGGLQYRGAGIRLVAFIVDAIVLYIILLLINQVSGSQVLVNTASGEIVSKLGWHQGVTIAILLAYYVGLWTWRGQTPGKMLVGAKIVKRDGSRIGIVRALLRFGVYFLYLVVVALTGTRLLILFVIIIVACMIIALNKRKRGIHDFIAGTVVVNSRAPKPQPVDAEAVDVSEEAEASSASEESEPSVASEPETDKTEPEK